MDINVFKEKLFAQGRAAGFSDMELYSSVNKSTQIRVFKGEVDNFTLSEEGGFSFRGVYNGKLGYAFTEVLDQEAIEMLIRDALENAQVVDDEDEVIIFGGSQSYPEFSAYSEGLANLEAVQLIQLAKDLEAKAYAADPRVKAVNYCMVAAGEGKTQISNTKELNLEQEGNMAYCYVSVVVAEGEDTKTFARFSSQRSLDKFDTAQIAGAAVLEATGLLGADSIDSGTYPVILRWEAATTLLHTFSGIFSAESVQKNLSLLKGKLGERIASELVTIVDDPLHLEGLYSTPFDAEGVATSTKTVVEKGVLKTFLHNLKTAKKDGVQSTGNAVKNSYKGSVSIAPTNMFIQPGAKSFEELVEGIDKGLVVIDLQGAHSGANPVSGDFSLGAFGYLVEGGKIIRPVNQITVAGNFFELLQDITGVGSDMHFGLPGGSQLGSPSLLISKLSVAGK